MKKIMNLSEETDGNFYKATDLVLLACDGCKSCGEKAICCRQTEDTIILDPYDIYMLQKATGITFSTGNGKYYDFRTVDGIILPFLLKRSDGSCVFLEKNGRCNIHASRPGFCRLFPLGRIYRKGGFDYILQTGQCPCNAAGKVTVSDWLGIEDPDNYDKFILSWHRITELNQKKAIRLLSEGSDASRAEAAGIAVKLLNIFYVRPYEINKSFYEQYYERLKGTDSALR